MANDGEIEARVADALDSLAATCIGGREEAWRIESEDEQVCGGLAGALELMHDAQRALAS